MTVESIDLDGKGLRPHEVYHMPPKESGFWASVTDVSCPVKGCKNTVVWWEAGYVPGYRVCARLDGGTGTIDSILHRFIARGTAADPLLVRER